MDKILLIDKPAGWTSFDVVAKIRSQIRQNQQKLHEGRGFCTEGQDKEATSNAESRTVGYGDRVAQSTDAVLASEPNGTDSSSVSKVWRCKCRVKAGHAGTLDPFATGLLIILVGEACKKADQFMKLDKTYEFTAKLGENSSTGDPEGEVSPVSSTKPSLEAIREALEQFRGQITQTPPKYSAIKINGKRAYKLAREGREVEIPTRKVEISRLELVDYSYPYLKCVCDVSSGTYIRSLVEDIGKTLKTGAYCTELRRTRIGDYQIKDAQTVHQAG